MPGVPKPERVNTLRRLTALRLIQPCLPQLNQRFQEDSAQSRGPLWAEGERFRHSAALELELNQGKSAPGAVRRGRSTLRCVRAFKDGPSHPVPASVREANADRSTTPRQSDAANHPHLSSLSFVERSD